MAAALILHELLSRSMSLEEPAGPDDDDNEPQLRGTAKGLSDKGLLLRACSACLTYLEACRGDGVGTSGGAADSSAVASGRPSATAAAAQALQALAEACLNRRLRAGHSELKMLFQLRLAVGSSAESLSRQLVAQGMDVLAGKMVRASVVGELPCPRLLEGSRVVIKPVPVPVARAAQGGHGGWNSSRPRMLGKTGVVECIDADGDVQVRLDDGGGSALWNRCLVEPRGGLLPASMLAAPLGVKVRIKRVPVAEAREAQRGHGGFTEDMEAMLGKPAEAELLDMDGDAVVRVEGCDDCKVWNPDLLAPVIPL
ncbi:hypothetical protein PLESTB_000893500 [Pleodorina starrii]|uniref:Mind bomb SH3 repeat domain-containing protein n=1 Tax=Pleodorina starrii TaxID=330485 RepID=A0A9W6BN64_9CHLO|nr:hypothetical protein PLESTM_000887400 [Pleodorina starrii]GLC54667.1 hypothetical protein PLESTB_000893500 [Pleodorina starrii]GLC67005.1 hypothetical protein PLESTF_000501300 [Pleodorina starrii]